MRADRLIVGTLALAAPAARAEPAAAPGSGAGEEPGEVVIVESESEGARTAGSAEAVTVVDTEAARRQSADLATVVARTEGVGVQRTGGLGSEMRFSLEGFTDDQVRFFLDGVPLESAGFPSGLASIPVGLVDRVEVYRGVVPLRFGADALGGAVNLVTRPPGPGQLTLSYQGGSFDTHRLGAVGGFVSPASGLFVRGSGWFDTSANDYPVDVQVADRTGQLHDATVRRFHDGYRFGGATVEAGVAGRAWADLAALRLFGSRAERDIQNNVVMTVPYREPWYGVDTVGASARVLAHRGQLHLEAVAGYTHTERTFEDLGACTVDWFGQCVAERSAPGELTEGGADQSLHDHSAMARVHGAWRPAGPHEVTVSVAPTWFTRSGEDHTVEPGERDPLAAVRQAVQVVGGVEYRVTPRADRLDGLLFVKGYGQAVQSEEPIVGGGNTRADSARAHGGAGAGIRVDVTRTLRLKASYEWATRLPTADELFGDGVLVVDNPTLAPETSHNVNFGATLEGAGAWGTSTASATGFWRESADLVVLLGNDRSYRYENVFGARCVGVEGAVGWTAPGDWVALGGNATWLDLRNDATDGAFADYAGDRIPNRPWLYANVHLGLGVNDVAGAGSRLSLDGHSQYVHGFFRGWESVGLAEFKQSIPDQLSHSVALTYAVIGARGDVSASVEVQNITDAALYDVFGVQRPGRAVFAKFTVSHSTRSSQELP